MPKLDVDSLLSEMNQKDKARKERGMPDGPMPEPYRGDHTGYNVATPQEAQQLWWCPFTRAATAVSAPQQGPGGAKLVGAQQQIAGFLGGINRGLAHEGPVSNSGCMGPGCGFWEWELAREIAPGVDPSHPDHLTGVLRRTGRGYCGHKGRIPTP